MPRVFLITGCSSGLGRHYAQEVLDQGDYVVATARDPSTLQNFTGTTSDNFLPHYLDITDKTSIEAAFTAALAKFSRVDVVCNNAGYGLAGCFEEYTAPQIEQQMQINFFGLLDVTRIALETMRNSQVPPGGLIQNITSLAGQRALPLFSIYSASKWAVEGFTEALSLELKPEWNINLQLLEPGGFRTDLAGRSMVFADRHPAYDHIDVRANMEMRHGSQPGDPVKGARAMYEFAVMENPPFRAVIGTDAYKAVLDKVDKYEMNYKAFEKIANSTDVDGYVPPL